MLKQYCFEGILAKESSLRTKDFLLCRDLQTRKHSSRMCTDCWSSLPDTLPRVYPLPLDTLLPNILPLDYLPPHKPTPANTLPLHTLPHSNPTHWIPYPSDTLPPETLPPLYTLPSTPRKDMGPEIPYPPWKGPGTSYTLYTDRHL